MMCAALLAASCHPSAPAASREAPAPEQHTVMAEALWREATAHILEHAARAAREDPWILAHPSALEALPAPRARPETWRRGVSLGLFASAKDPARQREIYGELLDEIVAVGATDVSIVVRWWQRDIHATEIEPREGVTVDDALVGWVMDAARARGLRVFLMPIIYLEERARGKWRGTLAPRDEDAWWASYETFILHYARLAEEHEVSLFSVGSELLSMEPQQARWRALIARARGAFSGKLTYSANWDHFEVPAYWDALDVVGMTAYQELTDAPNPSLEQLKEGWRTFKMRLRIWTLTQDRDFIFTEIGYPSHREGAARPWDYTPRSLPAHDLQARSYRAMFETWHDNPRLRGLYVWNWFGFKRADDRGYTPRGKPAEKVLEHWYERSR